LPANIIAFFLNCQQIFLPYCRQFGNGSFPAICLDANPLRPCYIKGMANADAKSIFDLKPDVAHEARLDAEAEAAYAAGKIVSHERADEWLAKLAKGERVPPPRA
jgi:hypothetical protein